MFRKFSLFQIVLFIFGIFALWSGISYLRDNMDLAENGEVVVWIYRNPHMVEHKSERLRLDDRVACVIETVDIFAQSGRHFSVVETG